MKKIAFILVLVLFLASTTAWACWNCYGHRPSTSYSQTKAILDVENKYSEQLNKLEEDLELKQLEIYKLLDNPDSTVGQVTAKEKEFDAIEDEYFQLVNEMKEELSEKDVRPRYDRHPMGQHQRPHMGYDHQNYNMRGYGPGSCWQ